MDSQHDIETGSNEMVRAFARVTARSVSQEELDRLGGKEGRGMSHWTTTSEHKIEGMP